MAPTRKRISLIAGAGAAALAAAGLAILIPTSNAADGVTADEAAAQQNCDGSVSAPGTLTGDLGAHDPAVVVPCEDGEPWYVFATGDGRFGDGTIPIRSSTDGGTTWTSQGTIWDSKPQWLVDAVPGVDNLWAPEVYYDAGQGRYYMYYSASTFGDQRSVIGLTTNTTLDPADPDYEWVDEGQVWESNPGDPYNAIDPNIIVGEDGTHYMAYGSWWQGIFVIELDWPSGKAASGANPVNIANRGGSGIEAPSMVEHDGMYYLFTSWDTCCAGADSTYNIRVGRSESPTGPFVDANGVALTDGGGTLVLAGHGDYVATGGQSISNGLMAYHSYHSAGHFDLGIEAIEWNADGWPVLDGQ
ncbi:arabinan endo-1,5-alpha-L-arabinosidase [Glycomyces tenuis]|uniref:arabinan endo-1,5-alpha-L-arabinosidase n=1 Tax=Glycomyces tenuis TaxID=58116 RepID=UPI000424B68B|nr:arabinan endo-1,5-alpha-L-arabinosidase [Glycomyces tenuis]